MTKGFHKKKSKRTSLKRRYNIEKKVKQHNKKIKKLARKEKQKKKEAKEARLKSQLEDRVKRLS